MDDVLKTAAFGPVESLRLTTFTLGNKAPRVNSVRTFPLTPDDEVVMEWAVSFTPNDLQDLTAEQAKGKVNPKIVLSIKLGKKFISGSMPVLLEDITFKGCMRIKLKLVSNFPYVKTVSMSFLKMPDIDYVLKPIGGDTFGVDINSIPGLSSFVKDQIYANIGPMMCEPNVFTLNLEQILAGTPLDSAIGVLKVHVQSGRGLKATKLGGRAPDPYVTIGIGAKPVTNISKTIDSSANPTWNETHYLLVNSLNDNLSFTVYDYNEHRPDSDLGNVLFDLSKMDENAEQPALSSKIIREGKERGELNYGISYFPVLKPTKLPDGTVEDPPESSTGIVRLTVHQAKGMPSSSTHTYAIVSLGKDQEIFRTAKVKGSAPVWNAHTEFLVPEQQKSIVTVALLDHNHTHVGKAIIRLTDLLSAKERQQDWFPLSPPNSGSVRLTTDWKPLLLPGSVGGASGYTPAIGIIRLWLKKAEDIKNVEFALGGKSDPYIRVLVNNQVLGRTDTVMSSLNPEWDEILYVPIHHMRQRVLLELMDTQNLTKDRIIGAVDLKVSDYVTVQENNTDEPFASKGPRDQMDPIKLMGSQGVKGRLFYQACFVPGVRLQGGVNFDPIANGSSELKNKDELSKTTVNTPVPKIVDAPMSTSAPEVSGTTVAPVATQPITEEGPLETEEAHVQPGVAMSPEELLMQGRYIWLGSDGVC